MRWMVAVVAATGLAIGNVSPVFAASGSRNAPTETLRAKDVSKADSPDVSDLIQKLEVGGDAAQDADMADEEKRQDAQTLGELLDADGASRAAALATTGDVPTVADLPRGAKVKIAYRAYTPKSGWDEAANGRATKPKKARGVEALTIELGSGEALGDVWFRARTADSGWPVWHVGGSVVGEASSDQSLEAVQIKLTGPVSVTHNVWYRVRVKGIGWMGWAKNGQSAGSAGMSCAITSVQVKVVPKEGRVPSSAASPYINLKTRAALQKAPGKRGIEAFGGLTLKKKTVKKLKDAIKGIRARGYDLGFIMMDLKTCQGVAYNCDALFYGASSIKAPYIASVVSQHPEAVEDYQYDITETLLYSSNENYTMLYDVYGSDPMQAWCRQSGADESLLELMPWTTYSARDLALMWARTYLLYRQSEAGEQIGAWCEDPNVSTIHDTLSKKYRTRSKGGWIASGGPQLSDVNGGGPEWNVTDDGGIVYAKNGAYVVAIMSSVPSNHDMLNPLTAAIDAAHSEIG